MEDQPTPSTQTNALIQLATQVASGQADPQTLHGVLEQRLAILAHSREDFETKAEAMGEAFTIPNAPLIERVEECFDAFEQALQHMAGYFESKNAKVLHEGNEQLVEVTAPMIAVVQEYAKAYLTFGPSPYLLMNSVRNTLRSIVDKGVEPGALDFLVKEAIAQNDQALVEVDASKVKDQEGYQAKRAAYVSITEALRALKPVDSHEDIDAAVAPLQSGLEAITAADEKIFAQNTALAPTPMPAANVLINTARATIQGVYSIEVMEETLTWYTTYLEGIEEQFDTAIAGETDSVVILEELPKTREIMDLHDEVISDLKETLEDFTAENVEPLLEDLIEVVERLKDSSEVYLEVARREGKLVCVACGHPNPPQNRVCEACAQKLPQLVDPNLYASSTFELEERGAAGADEEDGVVTENTLRLFQACYAFYEQNISKEEFLKVINWSRATVETTDRALSTVADKELTAAQLEGRTEEEIEAFEANRRLYLDSRQVLVEGMDDWSEGLDLLENYIETRHRPTIEAGIQRIWVGSQKLYQVQKVSEIADRALAELEAEERAKAAASGSGAAPTDYDEEIPAEDDEDSDIPVRDPDLL